MQIWRDYAGMIPFFGLESRIRTHASVVLSGRTRRESIKQIVFGRPTPIGVAFLLERLLIISSAAPSIEEFEGREMGFYYRRQFTFRKVSPISGRNHRPFPFPSPPSPPFDSATNRIDDENLVYFQINKSKMCNV